MFPRKDVLSEVRNFIPVELYTDRPTKADEQNRDLEQRLAGVVTLPAYVIVSPEGKALRVFQGSTRDPIEFIDFLKSGHSAAESLALR